MYTSLYQYVYRVVQIYRNTLEIHDNYDYAKPDFSKHDDNTQVIKMPIF